MEEIRYIQDIIKDNTLDYSAYVLLNRAIPSLYDGLKPVYRRILYTMFEEKAFKFTKSATMSGKVMKYHPHGDCYPTMVGLAQKDNNIIPYLVGKGNFGQHTSKNLMYGSSRYTEVKLSEFARDIMKDLNSHAIDFIPNYDNTSMMPELLPVKFPNILLYSQSGIGVGMASDIPSFNMIEVYENIKEYIESGVKNILVPDFATKGEILFNEEELNKINNKGVGSIKLRGRYKVEGNKIIITEIPYTTNRETIINKIIELRDKKFKEITNITDTTNLKGMSITIHIKNNTNVELLMNKLYKFTKLEDSYSANMNMLVDGLPKVVGVWECIERWIDWRVECIRKSVRYEISKMKNNLHLSEGIKSIANNVDEIIDIIKATPKKEVSNKISSSFNVDIEQSTYIAKRIFDIINRESLNEIIKEIDIIENEISKKEDYLIHKRDILNTILKEMKEVVDKYGQPRNTEILSNVKTISQTEIIEDYNCRIVFTQKYIKKHLKQSTNHKFKDGEIIQNDITSNNKHILLIFTNKQNRYKINVSDLDTLTPNSLGQYLPALCGFEEGESVVNIISLGEDDMNSMIIAMFDNGNLAKVPVTSFISRSSVLTNCFTEGLKYVFIINEDTDILCISSEGKAVIINTKQINIKKSKNTKGNSFMNIPNEDRLFFAGEIGVNDSVIIETDKQNLNINMQDLDKEERTLFEYLTGNKNNKGKFIYNCRAKKDKIIKIKRG